MAAEFLLTFAVQQILKKLGSFSANEVSRAWGLETSLESLAELTTRIGAVLQDGEDNKTTDEHVRSWLLKFQDAIYAAEDVLDDFAYETLRKKVEIDQDSRLIRGKARNFLSIPNHISFRLRMARRVKEIKKSMVGMEKQAMGELALRSVTTTIGHGAPQGAQLDRETDSRLDTLEAPIGREGDISTIINLLVSSSSSQQPVTTIAIVGMAGLGKTTLAKLVFKRAREQNIFGTTIWICVSENFSYKTILGGMLQALDAHATGSMNYVESILDHLENKLQGESFLLVLDDVWNEEFVKWNSLKCRLEKICKRSGNVVLVTTRSKKVASTMDTWPLHMHELKGLSDEECWSIIKQKACQNGGGSLSHGLETIGKEIATRCGGVPLAAMILGGILRSKEVESWATIKDEASNAVKLGNDILPILKLSFDHLPSSIKPCFAYCSLFPKDFIFGKDFLIQIWMAEGFLNPCKNSGTSVMEDIGNEYFNNLLATSLFQDVAVNELGEITGCKMHDLVHDLALSISAVETSVVDEGISMSNKVEVSDRIRRLVLNCNMNPGLIFPKGKARKLRCLLSFVNVMQGSFNFKGLRILLLQGHCIKELPASIGNLKHLRYLDVSNSKIAKLPESITKLYNLQTLRLIWCFRLGQLPRKMRDLVSLRHICFSYEKQMPTEVGRLTNLKTLSLFVMGGKSGNKIQELEGLAELGGELSIVGLEHATDEEEARRAKLREKMKLSKLVFKWGAAAYRRGGKEEQVLEALQPPPNLQSLKIENFMGNKIPSWLPMNLMKLDLENCKGCELIPSLGHLPRLEFLKIEGMSNLKSIGIEFYGEKSRSGLMFPALKEFTLWGMDNLVEWVAPPPEVASSVFPCLEKLDIDECGLLESIPTSNLSSLLHLKISNCEELNHLSNQLFPRFSAPPVSEVIRRTLVRLPSTTAQAVLTSLRTLRIEWCLALTSLPAGLQFCYSLKTLKIWYCVELIYLPEEFGRFTSLEVLEIGCCPKLVSLKVGLQFCTSLKSLTINSCEELNCSMGGFSGLTCLNKLDIRCCPKLTPLLDGLELCTSLGYLVIESCSRNLKQIPSVQYLTALKTLEVRDCGGLTLLPVGLKFCKSLHKLAIRGCKGLVSLPEEDDLKELRSLVSLVVSECPRLTCCPEDWLGQLTRLKKLTIGGFWEELDEFPGLNSICHLGLTLQELSIHGWSKLDSLPHQLEHLSALSEFYISYFDGVEAFPEWLANLSSLKQFSISYCGRLKSLPTSMQRLSKLKTLEITFCPLLEERCAANGGPDWHNISHIPEINIDFKSVQKSEWCVRLSSLSIIGHNISTLLYFNS